MKAINNLTGWTVSFRVLPLPHILDSFESFRCIIASVGSNNSWERDQDRESTGTQCNREHKFKGLRHMAFPLSKRLFGVSQVLLRSIEK
jgi:hypothetical protein